MTSKPFDDMLGVMVLYQKRMADCETFSSLFGSLSGRTGDIHLVIYDNSPVPMHVPEEFSLFPAQITYISDTSNPGVSKAYNTAYTIARQLNRKWLLLLDQDTVFPEDALSIYAAHIESTAPALLAPMLVCDGTIYSPCRQVGNINFPLRTVQPGLLPSKGLSVLNSGMYIHLDAYEKAGGFDERIRLDFADHDFMKRYRRYFENFLLIDMVCQHGFSDKETSDIDTSLARFRRYCEGARNSIKSPADPLSLLPLILIRATRLSLRYRSTRFLRVLVRTFSRN
jgi:rhamnosyltransferase